jgi:hypothetical protein
MHLFHVQHTSAHGRTNFDNKYKLSKSVGQICSDVEEEYIFRTPRHGIHTTKPCETQLIQDGPLAFGYITISHQQSTGMNAEANTGWIHK